MANSREVAVKTLTETPGIRAPSITGIGEPVSIELEVVNRMRIVSMRNAA